MPKTCKLSFIWLQCSSILFLYPSSLIKVFEWFKVSWVIEKAKNYRATAESNQPSMYRLQNCCDTVFHPLPSQTSQTNHHGANDFIDKLQGITNLQLYSVEPQELTFVGIDSCVISSSVRETEAFGLLPICLSFDTFFV